MQAAKDVKPSHGKELRYLHLPADDYPWQDLRQYFPEAFRFIDEGRQAGR
jgi:hypothetical protein